MSVPDGDGELVYIAGPMRGHKWYNFAAFDAARDLLLSKGYNAVSPADMERENGFDPTKLPEDTDWTTMDSGTDLACVIKRDIEALLDCEAIYLLPGWKESKGAASEAAVACWAGLPVIYLPPEDDILEEALALTTGPRQATYGPPDQDFARTAKMWSALKGVEFEAREVAMFMICLKLSRETHQKKRDNWVDMAGYSRCGSLCE